MSAGIDYGMGRTNIDHATGIRYGVIHHGEVGQTWYDESEAYYGEPTCPQCGDSVADTSGYGDDEYKQYGHGCADYVCHSCKHTLDSSDVYGDEPISHTYDADGYVAEQGDHDIFIAKAPYYTYAPFCSPCAPGAGYLGSADKVDETTGIKTYCFGHDWFDDGQAPYRVFRVDDDTEVMPDAH